MSVLELIAQPFLAVFPHGLQHGSRRNAYQAMGLAAKGRRDRQAAEQFVAAVRQASVPAASEAAPGTSAASR